MSRLEGDEGVRHVATMRERDSGREKVSAEALSHVQGTVMSQCGWK